MGFNVPFVNITKNMGTGIPFVDFDSNNPKPNENNWELQSFYDPAAQAAKDQAAQSITADFANRGNDPYVASDPYAASRSQDLAGLDSNIGYLQSLFGSADRSLNTGLSQLENDFNREKARADEDQARVMRDYGTKRTDTEMGKQSAIGKVDQGANTLSESLRRIIGMASGRGSSAYQFAAPNTVARDASTKRGDVLSTYGKNSRDLDTAETDAKSQFERLLEDLMGQRTTKEGELRSGIETQKQNLNQQLSQLFGERARVSGADYNGIRAAQQPYLSAIQNSQAAIDSYGDRFKNAYTPKAVNVQQPQLSDYIVDRSAINANNQAGGQQQYSPYSYFAKKKFNEA